MTGFESGSVFDKLSNLASGLDFAWDGKVSLQPLSVSVRCLVVCRISYRDACGGGGAPAAVAALGGTAGAGGGAGDGGGGAGGGDDGGEGEAL